MAGESGIEAGMEAAAGSGMEAAAGSGTSSGMEAAAGSGAGSGVEAGGVLGGALGATLGIRPAIWIAFTGSWAAGWWVFFSPLRHMRDIAAHELRRARQRKPEPGSA